MISNQGDIGGAIVSTGSVVSISGNTIITNNKANRGGGIYLQDSIFEIKGVHVLCFIFNNTALVQGGGIYAFGSTIIVYQRSALGFIDNSAEKGSGVYLEVNSKILVKKQYLADHSSPIPIMNFAGNKAILILEEQYMWMTSLIMEHAQETQSVLFRCKLCTGS